jgi:hypothetical protein
MGVRQREFLDLGEMVPVILDVTGDVSIQNAVERVQEETGADGLWALINNAGVAVGGPVEEGVQPIGDAKLTLFFQRDRSHTRRLATPATRSSCPRNLYPAKSCCPADAGAVYLQQMGHDRTWGTVFDWNFAGRVSARASSNQAQSPLPSGAREKRLW